MFIVAVDHHSPADRRPEPEPRGARYTQPRLEHPKNKTKIQQSHRADRRRRNHRLARHRHPLRHPLRQRQRRPRCLLVSEARPAASWAACRGRLGCAPRRMWYRRGRTGGSSGSERREASGEPGRGPPSRPARRREVTSCARTHSTALGNGKEMTRKRFHPRSRKRCLASRAPMLRPSQTRCHRA